METSANTEKESIVIWGAGHYGEVAYDYYRKDYNVIGFIDKSPTLQQNGKCGLPVYSPDYLKDLDVKVVIALAVEYQSAITQLKQYGINEFIVFKIQEQYHSDIKEDIEFDNNTVVIRFAGGLGNQLFVYAFALCMKERGKKIIGDLSYYNDKKRMPFRLLDVFPNFNLNCVDTDVSSLVKDKFINLEPLNCYLYIEPNIASVKTKKGDTSLLNITSGIIHGTFQTRIFPEIVEKKLRDKLVFRNNIEKKLEQMKEYFSNNNIIGVHVRRGDYLEGCFDRLFGGLCDNRYYTSAIDYLKKIDNTLKICFFSDDIEWVKENYNYEGAIYINSKMFDNYEEWYDLYLMSLCRHNIIANSTFSWWGAWLNQSENKIVIAPKRWANGCDVIDIYPEEWVKM